MPVWVTLPRVTHRVLLEQDGGDAFRFPVGFLGRRQVGPRLEAVANVTRYTALDGWDAGELSRLSWIPSVEAGGRLLETYLGAEPLAFLSDEALGWPCWMLWPVFKRFIETPLPSHPRNFEEALECLRFSERRSTAAFPYVEEDDEEDEDEDNDEDAHPRTPHPVRLLSLKLTLGWNRARAGGPRASRQAGYLDMFDETVSFGMLRAEEEWRMFPVDATVLKPTHAAWDTERGIVPAEHRTDLVSELSVWLNGAQLANEYSHTGTVMHARVMMDALFGEPATEYRRLDMRQPVRTALGPNDVFLNRGAGIECVDRYWHVNGPLLRFVSDEGHDRTYGTANFAHNARMELVKRFAVHHMTRTDNGQDEEEEEWEARLLAVEPWVYNPFMAFRTTTPRKYRFMRTRVDMLLCLQRADTIRIVLVEFKALMGVSEDVRTRVTNPTTVRQALTNAFLLATCSGIRASHVLLYYSTPYVPEFNGTRAYAFMLKVDPEALPWQHALFDRLSSNPFAKNEGAVYMDRHYTLSWSRADDALLRQLPQLELARIVRQWADPTAAEVGGGGLVDRVDAADDRFVRQPNGEVAILANAPWSRDLGVRVALLLDEAVMWVRIDGQHRLNVPDPLRPLIRGDLFKPPGPPEDNFTLRAPRTAEPDDPLRRFLYTQSVRVVEALQANPRVTQFVNRLTPAQLNTLTTRRAPQFIGCFVDGGEASSNRQPTNIRSPHIRTQLLFRFVHRLVSHYTLELCVRRDQFGDLPFGRERFHHNSRRDLWTPAALRAALRVVVPYVLEVATNALSAPAV